MYITTHIQLKPHLYFSCNLMGCCAATKQSSLGHKKRCDDEFPIEADEPRLWRSVEDGAQEKRVHDTRARQCVHLRPECAPEWKFLQDAGRR